MWDPLVRLFHWSLVAAFVVSWVTAEEIDRLHNTAGYVVLGLLAVRFVWGFVGPRHARFSNFVASPRVVIANLRSVVTFSARRYLGHNPAGGAMILALFITLSATSVSGWLMTTREFWGLKWLEDLHEGLANLSLGLVAAHVLGVLVSSAMHRENLVGSMLHGRKRKDT